MQKHFLLILLVLPCFTWHCTSSQRPGAAGAERLIIEENGNFGFVDGTGELVVAPVYEAAGEYNEGLAPVAMNGLFGYMNEDGNWAIEPAYHHARSFNNGLGNVWKNGKAMQVDRNGKLIDPSGNLHKYLLGENRWGVKTKSRKYGMMSGDEFLMDTVYNRIYNFKHGHAIVRKYNAVIREGKRYNRLEVGVVDTSGRFVIELGKYDELAHWGPDRFLFINHDPEKRDIKEQGIIDKAGTIVHKISHRDPIGKLENGIAISFFNKGNYSAVGIIGADGKWVFKDPDIRHLTSFGKKRLIVAKKEGRYLMDLKGNILHQNPFTTISDLFLEKYAFANTKESVGEYFIVDHDGNFVSKEPVSNIYTDFNFDHKFIIVKKDSSYFKFDKNGKMEPLEKLSPYRLTWSKRGFYWLVSNNLQGKTHKYGWFNPADESIVVPRFEEIDYYQCSIDYKWVKENGNWGYFDKWGNRTWQAKEKKQPVYLNYFSQRHSSYSPKKPRPLKWWQRLIINDFHVRTSFAKNIFNKKYKGLKVYISNPTKKKMVFDLRVANRLVLLMQAKDENGVWRDIETMDGMAYCGTGSRPSASLPPGHYWSFNIPLYDGVFKTKLRMALHQNPHDKNEEKIIWYSNEFNGGVNPGQFYKANYLH